MTSNTSQSRSMNGINQIEVSDVIFDDGSSLDSTSEIAKLNNQNIFTEDNVFTKAPTCSVDPTTSNELTRKEYIDTIETDLSNNITTALNNKINSVDFDTSTGVLSLTKEDASTLIKDLDGRYFIGETLEASDIPNLNADKITSGTLATDRIPNLNADKITSGTLADARIPNLNADKITTGTLADARIPELNAVKITSGILGTDRIPDLDTSKITSGILGTDRIPDLDTSKITSGILGTDRIPDLDTSKITSGVFDIARIPSAGAPSNMMTTDTTQTITGVKTFNGELFYSQGTTATNGTNIVNKNYVDSALTNKVSGYADIEMYFTAFTSATGTFYSNTEFELRWNSTYRQPTFKRVYGGSSDWWDIYHQAPAVGSGSSTPSTAMYNAKDDINTNYNGEYYFATSGSVNQLFNLNSYGQRNICFLTRESISTRRVYKIEYWCGSSSYIYIHLTVYQP